MTFLRQSLSPDAFAMLTLEAQIDHLSALLPATPADSLLELCAEVRDPAPLSWLCCKLAAGEWLHDAKNLSSLAIFLIAQSETSVHKVLRAITELPLRADARPLVGALMIEMLKKATIKQLSSICLLDRALRRHFPSEHEQYGRDLLAVCTRALQKSSLQEITLSQLAQLPAAHIEALRQTALGLGDDCAHAFETILAGLAVDAIEVLGDAPKAVSQANAEDLLARRVYTDPGHFLIELLQNAEDSGAKHWKVTFDANRIVVWHDGAHFDARDVVGVTSIGQTTKRKQQIGFFGVGFKSVYEVTDRPQIYSDVWKFEIADVSIPKVLSQRPDFVPYEGTTLVLPLRASLDEEHLPKSLYEKAAQLDACVLLTLRSIDVIELELTQSAGGPLRHALIEGVRHERSSIRHEPSGSIRYYWIRDDRYEYSGKLREAGRPDATMVMVGLHFDEAQNKPIQLEEGAATVYSYLPTREMTGLRFFVQGHFDVPLDRERIAPDSEWNRWILSQVPHQLAQIASKIASDNDANCAEGLLDVLPLQNELAPSLFQLIPAGLKAELKAIPFIPTADGSLQAAQDVLVAPPQIAALFEKNPVSANQFLLQTSLNTRAQELVLTIGASEFNTAQLLSYLENLATAFIDGKAPAKPNFFNDFKLMENLYDILLAEADRLEREGLTADLTQWLLRLRKLPIIHDSEGRLTAPQKLARASSVLREIYRGVLTFVDARFENASARTVAFMNRTGVLAVDVQYMVEHLERTLKSVALPMVSQSAAAFPGSDERLRLVLQVLCDAGRANQMRAARLPLFKSLDGAFWPAATAPEDRGGVLRVWGAMTQLAEFYGKRRPFINVEDAENPASILLDRLATPVLDLTVLCNDLSLGLFKLSLDGLRQLHVLLESAESEISDKLGKQLSELSIWPDRGGDVHPLRGSNAVLIPLDDEICQLFPRAAFLDREIGARKHIKRLSVEFISANHVAHGLTTSAVPPLFVPRTAESIERSMKFLLQHASSLDAKSRSELKESKAFFSDNDQIWLLQDLSIAESQEIRLVYGDFPARHFVKLEGPSLELIRVLGGESLLQPVNALVLISDLEKPQAPLLIPDAQARHRVLSYLVGQADVIPGAVLSRLARLAIFPDQKGIPGALPVFNTANATTAANTTNPVRPCEPGLRSFLSLAGLRLLDATIQESVQPLLNLLHTPTAGVEALIDFLSTKPDLPDAVLEPLQQALVERRAELLKLYPLSSANGQNLHSEILNELCIWKSRGGELISASRVVAPGALEILGAESLEGKALDQRSLSDQSFARLQKLAPLLLPMPSEQFICELVSGRAHDKQQLSAQPRFLGTVDKINQINQLIANQPGAKPVYVDALNYLRFEPLYYADASTYDLLQDLPAMQLLLHPDFHRVIVQKPKIAQIAQNEKTQPQGGFSKMTSIAGFFKRLIGEQTSLSEPSSKDSMAPESLTVNCLAIPPVRVLAALGTAIEAKRCVKFYAWLLANEDEIYSDPATRKKLADSPFFGTVSGAMVCPRDLVIETDLPDLGLDWFPSPDIPEAVLLTLQKRLDIGHPQLNDLVMRNVVPAYMQACEKEDKEKAGRLLQWLAQRLGDRSPAQIRDLVLPKNDRELLLEDNRGDFRPLKQLILPAPRISEFMQDIWGDEILMPSASRYSDQVRAFLADLGIPNTPSLLSITQKLENPQNSRTAGALAGLASYLRNQHGDAILALLPLQKCAWLPDGAGHLKVPSALFVRTPEVEGLIGTFPELFLAERYDDILGEALVRELKFRDVSGITHEDVCNHIRKRLAGKSPPPFAVYKWFDQQVQKKRIDAAGLNRLFGSTAWICTDDGEFFHHSKVLGAPAFHLFKARRGYWERGFLECRALCDALGIQGAATPAVVAAFVEDLGVEAKKKGTREMLAEEPALPHMLLSAFNLLAQANKTVDRDLPVIPCTNHKNETDLLPATAKNLFWSDTPTLEELFAKAGPLCLAMRGRTEERDGVEKFHESMGVRRLRDSFSLVADLKSGVDRSVEMSAEISALRSTLRALGGALRRVELERPLPPPSAWVYSKRLRALSENGAIKAAEKFSVLYVLPGVGETRVQQSSIYDAGADQLIVDTRVLSDTERTGLAEGIIGAIVVGPLSESFIDLVEILLARGSKERMNEYLDRRHFANADTLAGGAEHVCERIVEILDYGLDRNLKTTYPSLSESNLLKWKQAGFLAKVTAACGENDIKNAACTVAPLMVQALALSSEPAGLPETLEKMLAAHTLSEATSILSDQLNVGGLSVTAMPLTTLQNARDKTALSRPDPGSMDTDSDLHPIDSDLRDSSHAALQKIDDDDNSPLYRLIFIGMLIFGGLVCFFAWLLSNHASAEAVSGNNGLLAIIAITVCVLLFVGAAVFAIVHFDLLGIVLNLNQKFSAYLKQRQSAPAITGTPEKQPFALPNLFSAGQSSRIKLPKERERLDAGRDDGRSKNRNISSLDGAMKSAVGRDQKHTAGYDFESDRNPAVDAGRSEEGDSSLPAWATGNCFQPAQSIPAQFWATRAGRSAINARDNNAQILFNPPNLPPPYQYAVHRLGIVFDPVSQIWSATDRLRADLNTPGIPSNRFVQFEGLLEPGQNQLPLPLYGRIVGEVQAGNNAVPYRQDALTAYCEISGSGIQKVKYRVHLLDVPDLQNGDTGHAEVDRAFLQPTVSLEFLPPEVQDWIELTVNSNQSLTARALSAQAFVRKHYAYDDGYLERREVRRARGRLPRGKGNHHLTLLHASAEGDILGRGVCYELNVLLVELLRRVGVPALTATGWVLLDGTIEYPDHLFALAVVPSQENSCLLTLDAAATESGVIRTLGARKSPRLSMEVQAHALPPVPQPTGAWNIRPTTNNIRSVQDGVSSGGGSANGGKHTIQPSEQALPASDGRASVSEVSASSAGRLKSLNEEDGRRTAGSETDTSGGAGEKIAQAEQKRRYVQAEIILLRDAIKRVCAATGASLPKGMPDDSSKLSHELALLLGDRTLAEIYLQILRGDVRRLETLSPQVQKLSDMLLVQVEPISAYSVGPL